MASTASRLDIYNMALGFIGTGTIGSPNERRPEAIQCDLYWDRARRAALRDYPYSFARRRVQLAEKPLPDVYEEQWHHAYAWPEKCIKVVRMIRNGREVFCNPDFVVRNEGSENIILTDVEVAQAEIVVDQEDISLWDDLFVLAMARKLAAMVCVPLLKNNQAKLQELEQLYQLAIPKADGQDASERRQHRKPDGWLLVRGGW